ncbi:MAG: M48 family metalloprotease [Alphaproteobacteria bacterium]|nr:M48 family metalloprotease [Alphaproteobacteria bacterium]
MNHIQKTLFILTFSLLVACAPTMHMPQISDEMAQGEALKQQKLALGKFLSQQERLQRIAHPILTKNIQFCENDIGPVFGFGAATQNDFGREWQQAAAEGFGLAEQPTVFYVGAGSAASGKLQKGDVLLAVDGKAIGKQGTNPIKNNKNSEITLTIDRHGKQKDVTLRGQKACDHPSFVELNETVNAYADGNRIVFTTGMMNFANDTELATVYGHELAHNVMGHIDSKMGNAALGALLGAVIAVGTGVDVTQEMSNIGAGAYSQSFEGEADYVGLYLTARGGYSIANASHFWRKMAEAHPASIHLEGGSHPSTAKRFLALEHTVKEINKKKAAGQPLVPNKAQ